MDPPGPLGGTTPALVVPKRYERRQVITANASTCGGGEQLALHIRYTVVLLNLLFIGVGVPSWDYGDPSFDREVGRAPLGAPRLICYCGEQLALVGPSLDREVGRMPR